MGLDNLIVHFFKSLSELPSILSLLMGIMAVALFELVI